MPLPIAAPNPTLTLPYSLAIAFQPSRAYTVDENLYVDGSTQTGALSVTSRKKWVQTKRLTVAEWDTLLVFYSNVQGRSQDFWFYDVYETIPIFSYDETGSEVIGRYAVKFDSQFQWGLDVGRTPVQDLALIEVG